MGAWVGVRADQPGGAEEGFRAKFADFDQGRDFPLKSQKPELGTLAANRAAFVEFYDSVTAHGLSVGAP
jgi:hypothetical protein